MHEVPSKYARLQTSRVMFGTNEGMTGTEEDESVVFVVRASWACNIFLLLIKIYCYYISSSKVVLSTLADSVVDLISQFILATGDQIASTPDNHYPVGRARIESLSVMGSAAIMTVASVEVIQCKYCTVL